MPRFPENPAVPVIPEVPEIPDMPEVPKIPAIPVDPGLTRRPFGAPPTPRVRGIWAPGEDRSRCDTCRGSPGRLRGVTGFSLGVARVPCCGS